jgi:lysophospholipase L1-like esterase
MQKTNFVRRLLSVFALLLAAEAFFLAWPAGAADFFFKDNDRVVMIGDSITEQYLYSNYVEAWTLTRFPTWNITFINVGIGGDQAVGGNSRFARDVLPYHPTALTVDFGMNDGGYGGFDPNKFKAYMGGLQGIATQAKAANLRVAWCTPSPVEKPEQGPALKGYNETLEKFSDGVKQTAEANQGLFIDQFHPFVALIQKARDADPKNRIGGGDAVHPGPAGQSIMASAILKGMSFPTLVASVEINAAGGQTVKSQNCKIDNLKVAADGKISFTQQDAALPFFPDDAKGILRWSPILDDMNDYHLKVSGLKAAKYEVRLGGQKVGEYSAASLAEGVNLASAALVAGPVAEQVKSAWNAIKAKNDFFHGRIFRGVVLAQVNVPDFLSLDLKPELIQARRDAALQERMAKMPELFDAIKKTLVIQPHEVEIVPIAK